MHFFPNLYCTKKAKRAISFSNPLTGTFYSNQDFLKNCITVPRSISYLDHMKQLTSANNNEQVAHNLKKKKQNSSHLKKQQRKRIERQIVAVHATSRMAESANKNPDSTLTLDKRCRKALDNTTMDQLAKVRLNKTFTINQSLTSRVRKTFRQIQKTESKKGSPKTSFVFHDIQILILDLLDSQQDFRTKILRINLQKYYRSFFNKQLSGHFTQQFLSRVQHYIEKLQKKNELDGIQIDQQQYPVQLFTVSTKMVFMNKLLELQTKKTASNQDNIEVLIRHYCIPSKEFRESCLRDILFMLTLEIYEKFNCSRQQQYILLDQNGTQIQQILQIKFSTKRLFLTQKVNAQKNYNNYLQLLDQFYCQGKKLTFNQNIKLSFRHRLAQGNYDDSHFNYCQNYELLKLKRNSQLQVAQNILRKRAQTHRTSKLSQRQQTLFYEKEPTSLKSYNQGPSKSLQCKIQTRQTSQKRGELSQFWKIQNTRISPQLMSKVCFTPKGKKSSMKSSTSPLKNYSQFQKSKLKLLLHEDKARILNAQIQSKFGEEFKDLVSKNDFFDFNFNHKHNKERIMKQSLRQYFIYFKDKSDDQTCKIMESIKTTTKLLNGNDKDSQQRHKQQGSENNQDRQLQAQQLNSSLNWEQFKDLRTTIQCMQPKQVVMKFVGEYLNFNQYGELTKSELFSQISGILGGKIQIESKEVIAEVIWSWFQANSIIQNGFIRRMTLESWYEKYKIVYCMLVSLIFGTNHKTALDLAYQILL